MPTKLAECDSWMVCNHEDLQVKLANVQLDKTTDAVLDFSAVLTSSRRDRDGDELFSAGAEIDEKMPLLWQHKPAEPIGRYVKTLARDNQRVVCQFAIADTEIGRDAATLLKFGALRMSHGFKPLEAEPQKDGRGWQVKRFSIVEASLVSVAANIDAAIQAHTAGKLFSPTFKQFAGMLARNRKQILLANCCSKAAAAADDCKRRLREVQENEALGRFLQGLPF